MLVVPSVTVVEAKSLLLDRHFLGQEYPVPLSVVPSSTVLTPAGRCLDSEGLWCVHW